MTNNMFFCTSIWNGKGSVVEVTRTGNDASMFGVGAIWTGKGRVVGAIEGDGGKGGGNGVTGDGLEVEISSKSTKILESMEA